MAPTPPTEAKHPEEIVLDADESAEDQELDQEQGNAGAQEDGAEVTGLATPPSDMDVEKLKVSRKREREVSLEPSTPQAATVDLDAPSSAQKDRDRRTPAKKNRTSAQLDSTAEQDEDGQDALIFDESDPASRSTPPSRSGSSKTPPLENGDSTMATTAAEVSASPPHETKVRLISRGVKDLNWKSLGGVSAKLAFESSEASSNEPTEMDHEDETASQSTASAPAVVVPLGQNPPVVDDEPAGADEHGGNADPAEVPSTSEQAQSGPAEASGSQTRVSPPAPTPFPRHSEAEASRPSPPPSPPSGSPRAQPLLPSAMDEDVKSGLKRKLGDRTVSERHISGDIGERKGKRASPPPTVEEAEEQTEKSNAAKPQLSGFMAYASTSSPFAKVKGPSVFSSSGSSSLSQSKRAAAWSPTTTSGANQSPPTSSSPFSFTPSTSPSKPDPSPPASAVSPVTTTAITAWSPSASPTSNISTPQTHAPQKRTGFEAFASTSSPFASAAKRPKSPPPAFASTSTSGHGLSFGFGHLNKSKRSASPARTSVFGSSSASGGAASAFSAYASAGSPFKSAFGAASTPSSSGSSVLGSALDPPAREGSPLNGVSKGSVLGASPTAEKEEADGERAKVSFGDRLRASKDTEEEDSDGANGGPKVELTEQEVMTGEEDEETVFQARGKLYSLSEANQWKERGTGNLKLNVRRVDGSGARLVMRKEAVYTLLLNATLFKGMKCFLAQDPRYLRFSVFEGGIATHYNLRVSNAKIAEDLLMEINDHIPTD